MFHSRPDRPSDVSFEFQNQVYTYSFESLETTTMYCFRHLLINSLEKGPDYQHQMVVVCAHCFLSITKVRNARKWDSYTAHDQSIDSSDEIRPPEL